MPQYNPPLGKVHVITYEDYRVYAVNPLSIRNLAKADEEFDDFATHDDFPLLIPKDEIWISQRSMNEEGLFFASNALVRLGEAARGASQDRAYAAGLEVERDLREKFTGIPYRDGKPHKTVPPEIYVEPYAALDDPKNAIKAWVIDGARVRNTYKTDFTEGGNGMVYPWCPKNQLWVERNVFPSERPFIIAHEYLEMRLMRDQSLAYDRAHAICSKVEFCLRKGQSIHKLVTTGNRRFKKSDLPKLVRDEVFQYVVGHYVNTGSH